MIACRGFSLIELIIAVALIGVLSSVALGYYGGSVTAANRSEGRAALQTAAGTLEKCKSRFGVYNHANCAYADFVTESNYYGISGAIAATSFTLTATPIAGGSQAGDADCTTLTLSHIGVTGATGADPGACW